jgi:hypothetical protein
LVFDEAQILTEAAIDDMVPATNQAPNPLILFTGTPPKPSDPGEVFRAKRAEALSGESDDMLYLEFSADEDADPTDRGSGRRGTRRTRRRTPAAAMLRMKKNLTPESFLREAWASGTTTSSRRVPICGPGWSRPASCTAPTPISTPRSTRPGGARSATVGCSPARAATSRCSRRWRWARWVVDHDIAFEMYGAEDLELCDRCKSKPHQDPDGEHDYLCPDCREA